MAKNADRFDIVVIGSGPAGYVAAIQAAQHGASVAVVEKDSAFGGTCLHRGCIPTKALLETAHLLDKIGHADKFGITAAPPSLNMGKTQDYKASVVQANADGVAFLFKKNKVETIKGWGRLSGSGRVEVTQTDGKRRTVMATRAIILATGSTCKHLPHIHVDHERVIDSDDILELREVPKRLLVLGAGAVGTEFACIYNRFGSTVTLVEFLPRLLPLEDEEVSIALGRSFKKQGIVCHTGTRVTAVEERGEGVVAKAEGPSGAVEIEADMVLV
ncbi:MAG: FAD-dependent oxidoreductase, partial [Myxococcales bacterium]|nr:FAD-dependent oxidoreductase [Myxococcales bacterium]